MPGRLLDHPIVLCDLDGVVWLSGAPLPGAPEAIAQLRASGRRVLFVTNNSSATIATQEQTLLDAGVPAAGDVVTSAGAAGTLVGPGERVLVCGGPGIVEAMLARRAVVVMPADADALDVDVVAVGFHRHFDYEAMRVSSTAVRRGARLIATNDDATYPTPDGPIPGGGAIAASISTAAGVAPIVAGKPHEPMADAVAAATGTTRDALRSALVVGDRLETDGTFAATLGAAFALVRTGVTAPGAPIGIDVPLAFDEADLSAIAARLAG